MLLQFKNRIKTALREKYFILWSKILPIHFFLSANPPDRSKVTEPLKVIFLLQDNKMIKKKILFFSSSQKKSKSSCFLLFLPSQVLDFFAASRPTNVLLGTAMMDKPSFLDHKKAGKYQG